MVVLLSLLSLLTGTYNWVSWQGHEGLYTDLQQVPHQTHALLLGTNPRVMGRPNLYYVYRIQAVRALWRAGKFDDIIVSGSRRMTPEGLYDEISAMRSDLIAQGIPAEVIREDPDAHRTLLSIQRAQSVFGLQTYLIVSQAFHCERSLYIAHQLGQTPVCFAAQDVPAQPLMAGREMISRLVAVTESLKK